MIKKATGLGVSEFMLRFMAWLCLKDNSLSGSQMCIVTGPRIDLAIALIDRMKKLFAGKGLATKFDTKETVVELNNVKIEAFPSHHLDAMRGLPNVSSFVCTLTTVKSYLRVARTTRRATKWAPLQKHAPITHLQAASRISTVADVSL